MRIPSRLLHEHQISKTPNLDDAKRNNGHVLVPIKLKCSGCAGVLKVTIIDHTEQLKQQFEKNKLSAQFTSGSMYPFSTKTCVTAYK
jgi:hypothetical protein